ncbi:MAG: type II secretion system protein GspN [Nitrospirota bacterium]|nr:type II secretion system protein GspN [Nitrospirota bacterium]
MNLQVHQIMSRSALGWALYTIAALGVFFALTFPYAQLQVQLLDEVARGTGLEVHADRWEPVWPLGIAWNDVSATAPGLPRFGADRVSVHTEIWSLVQGSAILNGQIRLPGPQGAAGLITGQLALDRWEPQGPGRLTGSVERLNLPALSLPLIKHGTLRGTFDQRWTRLISPSEFLRGQGDWQAEVNGLDLEHIPVGPLTLPSVSFTSFKARLQCQDGTCRIEGLQGDGPDGTVSGEGVLTVREPLSDSRLILSLSLTVADAYKRRIPVAALLPGPPGAPIKVTLTGPLAHLHATL